MMQLQLGRDRFEELVEGRNRSFPAIEIHEHQQVSIAAADKVSTSRYALRAEYLLHSTFDLSWHFTWLWHNHFVEYESILCSH